MGSRYSVLIADGRPDAASMLAAVGAFGFEQKGVVSAPIPEGKLEPKEAAWLACDEWGVLVLGYAVGNTTGANASAVAQQLESTAKNLRYFLREDTSGELCAQRFEFGALTQSYAEVEGTCVASRLLGPAPAQDKAGQTDMHALLASLLPATVTLDDLERQTFQSFEVQWQQRTAAKKTWWPWRKAS